MNKKEFINAVAAACGQSIEETSLVMEAVQHVIKESLQKGEPIAIPGFGSFSVKERPGRMGRNPRTGVHEDRRQEGREIQPRFGSGYRIQTVGKNLQTPEEIVGRLCPFGHLP